MHMSGALLLVVKILIFRISSLCTVHILRGQVFNPYFELLIGFLPLEPPENHTHLPVQEKCKSTCVIHQLLHRAHLFWLRFSFNRDGRVEGEAESNSDEVSLGVCSNGNTQLVLPCSVLNRGDNIGVVNGHAHGAVVARVLASILAGHSVLNSS